MSGKVEDFSFSKEKYRGKTRRNMAIFAVCTIVLVVLGVYSLGVNQYGLDLGEILHIIAVHDPNAVYPVYRDEIEDMLVMEMYLPRMVGCITIGAILAVSGAVMQNVICNPLADSYTTGISSGAYFGMALAVILGFTVVPGLGEVSNIINAFLFSLIPCAIIILFSMFRKASPTIIILIGIAVNLIIGAFTSLLTYIAKPEDLDELYEWSMGTLNMIDPHSMPYLIIALAGIMVISMYIANKINIISTGDDYCTTVGIHADRFRVLSLLMISLFTAISVCFVGTIGFIGLVTPHIARMLVGANAKVLIPVSAIMGSMTLLISDCIARMLITGGLPAGLITAMVGGPVLMLLLLRQKGSGWS